MTKALKKYLITGSTGHLGTQICNEFELNNVPAVLLSRKRTPVRVNSGLFDNIQGDVADCSTLGSIRDELEGVVHTAAVFSFTGRDKANIIRTNVGGTRNIIKLCLKRQLRLVYTSSILTTSKMLRKSILSKQRVSPFYAYLASKIYAEDEITNAVKSGLKAVIINPGMMIGPTHDKNTPSMLLLMDLLKGRFPFYVDGCWPWSSVEDVAKVHYQALHRGKIGYPYVVVAKGSLSIPSIFSLLQRHAGIKPPTIKFSHATARCFALMNHIFHELGVQNFAYNKSLSMGGLIFSSCTDFDLKTSMIEEDFGITPQTIEDLLKKTLKNINKVNKKD